MCHNGRMRCVRDVRDLPCSEPDSLPECGVQTSGETQVMAEAYDWPEVFDGEW
ncbi:hypothetical protein GCM10011579_097890 [Streptomyces albiflavescens]|uniref:Uncharacterized protein n=1 Tax=Streptomyces albiflavescens TaxID=1623582 RepID=A0A917YHI1_9ACTN|nr:hypothetical protein GCM10011579_097890 [Streptomyces albiflavescens]